MADLNLNIETGEKTFTINEDPNKLLKFNPGDYNIMSRFYEVKDILKKEMDALNPESKINEDGTVPNDSEDFAKSIKKIDALIREKIDYIFGYSVSDIVFGTVNPLSTVGGIPYFERFFNAVIPFIEKELNAEAKKSEKKMAKYTAKYKK